MSGSASALCLKVESQVWPSLTGSLDGMAMFCCIDSNKRVNAMQVSRINSTLHQGPRPQALAERNSGLANGRNRYVSDPRALGYELRKEIQNPSGCAHKPALRCHALRRTSSSCIPRCASDCNAVSSRPSAPSNGKLPRPLVVTSFTDRIQTCKLLANLHTCANVN